MTARNEIKLNKQERKCHFVSDWLALMRKKLLSRHHHSLYWSNQGEMFALDLICISAESLSPHNKQFCNLEVVFCVAPQYFT